MPSLLRPLPFLLAAALFAACGDGSESKSSATNEDAGNGGVDASTDRAPAKDAANECARDDCFGGACPTGTCEPAIFVADAGEDVYRIRASATRVVWSAGFGTGTVSAKPFDGGPTTKVIDTSQAARTFDVEGETLTIIHSPSGIYQYEVLTGNAIGTRIPLAAGGIAPISVLDGKIYFRGNREGAFNPDGPNFYPLVSSPLATFGATTDLAKGVNGDDVGSILATTNGVFFAGKGGVFRAEADLTGKQLVDSKGASSLATDGAFLYWIEDLSLDGKRVLMRSKLDGAEAGAVGPEKVLSVAAIPGRLFYAVETGRYENRVNASLMVLGTTPQR